MKELAYIAGPMFGTAILPLLWYCYRSHGREDFNIWKFLFSNRARLGIGAVLMAYASGLIYLFPEVQAVLALGIGAGVAYAAIGWTVGSTLVALVPGNK